MLQLKFEEVPYLDYLKNRMLITFLTLWWWDSVYALLKINKIKILKLKLEINLEKIPLYKIYYFDSALINKSKHFNKFFY